MDDGNELLEEVGGRLFRWSKDRALANDYVNFLNSLMGLFGFALILFLRQTFVPQANTGLLLAAGCFTCWSCLTLS